MFRGNNLIGVQTANVVNSMNSSNPSYGWGNALAEALQGYQQGQQIAAEQKAKQEQVAWDKERFGIEQDNAMNRHNDELAISLMNARNQQAQWNKQNALDMYKAQQGDKTTDIKNYEYWLAQGLKPNEAQALATSGRTDAVGGVLANGGFGALGQAGAKEYDKAMGKKVADEVALYNSMTSKLPQLQSMVKDLRNISDAASYRLVDLGYDWLQKQAFDKTTEGALGRVTYNSIVENSVLPLLRDTFGAQFTEREGERLKATLGNPNYSPEEKEAALNAFINQKISDIESQYRNLQNSGVNVPPPNTFTSITQQANKDPLNFR